jgi:hypothetical protein
MRSFRDDEDGRIDGRPCRSLPSVVENMSQKMNKKLTWTSPNRIDIRVTLMIADIGEYILLILQVTTNTHGAYVGSRD